MINLKDLRVGVEIETVGATRHTVAQAIQSVVGGELVHVGTPSSFDPYRVTDRNSRIWTVVADSSLTSVAAHLRAEIVSPVLGYSDIPELQEVVRAVRKCGAGTDERTGIHYAKQVVMPSSHFHEAPPSLPSHSCSLPVESPVFLAQGLDFLQLSSDECAHGG